ncbi:MAG: DUF433 domain-containing protein [Candidatus Omnitrophota bacterium]
MPLTFSPEILPLEVDADEVVRIGKTRVTLDVVMEAFQEGATAEEIVQQYPSLQLADVYNVIGYCLRRSDEIAAYLEKRKKDIEAIRQENESRFDPAGIRNRLLARRSNREIR